MLEVEKNTTEVQFYYQLNPIKNIIYDLYKISMYIKQFFGSESMMNNVVVFF